MFFFSLAGHQKRCVECLFCFSVDACNFLSHERYSAFVTRTSSLYFSSVICCLHRFPVNDIMLEPLLEGLTIQQAIEQKRLFICDLKILEGLYVRPDFVVSIAFTFHFVGRFVVYVEYSGAENILPTDL